MSKRYSAVIRFGALHSDCTLIDHSTGSAQKVHLRHVERFKFSTRKHAETEAFKGQVARLVSAAVGITWKEPAHV